MIKLPLITLKPLTAWEKTQAKRKTLSKPLQVLTSLKTTAVLGAVLGTMLSPATAVRVATSVIPKTIKGKLAVGTVGLLAYKSPKVYQTIKGAPKSYLKAVDTTADIIEGKKKVTPDSVKDILKTAGIVTGLGVLGVGAGVVASKVLKAQQDKPLSTGNGGVGVVGTSPIGTGTTSPILPQTASITTKKRRYKPRTATKTPLVRQYVKVNIINKPVNTGIRVNSKKYINERILN